eukprot:GEMP01052858.1.p1 GENE.GEMP01052858.1~~GEMP01052858.1.p1  ORF type:complete len:288 (+),score=60.21 GEMP01052858.1:136-999(+)
MRDLQARWGSASSREKPSLELTKSKSDAQAVFQNSLIKTTMCTFFLRGQCNKGDQCAHAHSPDELVKRPNLTQTSLCKNFTQGKCSKGDLCGFAHGSKDLTATSTFYKTKMCRAALKCKLGDECRYAHSAAELRKFGLADTMSNGSTVLSSRSLCANTGGMRLSEACSSSASSHNSAASKPLTPNPEETSAFKWLAEETAKKEQEKEKQVAVPLNEPRHLQLAQALEHPPSMMTNAAAADALWWRTVELATYCNQQENCYKRSYQPCWNPWDANFGASTFADDLRSV